MIRYLVCILLLVATVPAHAEQDAGTLFETLRNKVLSVKDYKADIRMSVHVTFMRIPPLAGVLYYKSPDKMRLERNGGLSILPKKNLNLTLRNLIPDGKVTVLDAGTDTTGGHTARILKVIPEDDNTGIVLAKIWVDEKRLVALRTETTTRDEGTVIMDMEYNRYTKWSLPDKVTIHMDLKEYHLPAGVTMDYNNSAVPEAARELKKGKAQKGSIRISYKSYVINKGIPDSVFGKD